MMNTKQFCEEDIEILDKGISIKNTFFSKQEIADIFNELNLLRNFIETQ